MAQSIFGGATNYTNQSLVEIKNDIKFWLEFTKDICTEFQISIKLSKESGFWNKVPSDFRLILISSIQAHESYIHDFELILDAIENDSISKREVVLLQQIGKVANEYNLDYGKIYHSEFRWKDYGNPDFKIIENLYQNGRDHFVTLQDAYNASIRLKNYINHNSKNNSININNKINGNNNKIEQNIKSKKVKNNYNDNFRKEHEQIMRFLNNYQNIILDKKDIDTLNSILEDAQTSIDNNSSTNTIIDNMKTFIGKLPNKGIKLINLLSNFATVYNFFNLP